ncbi:MAG TPA: putative O-glycosylation ligase, exosortase A system-associated [Allosphingosinicella sp.]|nr:putative O-glycosylation ligase, exosortase A system-associated [Allosphingosinicella sp.]
MRDLALLGFLAALLVFGMKRPFLFVLAYIYVDTVSPHRLSYFLLNTVPLSMIVAFLALAGWLIADRKDGFTITVRQGLIFILLAYAGATTTMADFPLDAAEKWDWAWKALAFAIFLPFTLRTRLRIEAVLLFLTLSAAAIIIVGGIKTVLAGGGYGVLNLMVDNNSGLYESSTISTVAIGLIPLIVWFARFGTIFPPDWRVKLFCAGLVFACLLIPIGTEARTGLVCIGALGILMLRDVKRRFLYMGAAALLGLAAIPFLPSSFTSRMETIQGFQGDQSAGTRLAVWAWTWDYARAHPFGGGFGAYRSNRIQVQTVSAKTSGEVQIVTAQTEADEARAYHSSYFEMLGEQGFPGLALFLLIHGITLVRMEMIRRRYRRAAGEDAWIAPLATALQHFQLLYLVGSVFVGIAYQSFAWLILGAQIGFDVHCSRRRRAEIRQLSLASAAPAAHA